MIRQDGKKLIRYDNESWATYDLATDPDENAPLSLAANAALVAELEGYAVAEGLTRGVVRYRNWSGPNGGQLDDAPNWNSTTSPMVIGPPSLRTPPLPPRSRHVSTNVSTLGIEIKGETAKQVVEVHDGRTLSGRNKVRVGANGQ